MLYYTFPYVENFHCLAGLCPDSCCKGWEVVIDEPTLQTYQQCSKPIGDYIRKVLTKNEEQEWIFQNQKNGDCPFWNTQKLCDLQLQAGDMLLCDTCRMFPRIPQDYTIFTEQVLSLACPEAAKLVLMQEEPFQAIFSYQEDAPEIMESALPYSLDWMACLRETRTVLLQLLQNKSILLFKALCYGLHYVQQLQDWIEEKTDDFPQMQPIAAAPDFLHQEAILHIYDNMEWMTPEWADWMQQIHLHPVTQADLQAFQVVADGLILHSATSVPIIYIYIGSKHLIMAMSCYNIRNCSLHYMKSLLYPHGNYGKLDSITWRTALKLYSSMQKK